MPSAVLQTLRAVHEQKLALVAPSAAPQRLAFGLRRLAQAQGERVVFRETEHGEPLTTVDIGAVRAVAHGVDGSLFAVGLGHGTRLEARATKASDFPHTPFFPDALLFPVLEDPTHFDVYLPVERALWRFPFEVEAGVLLSSDASFELEGCVAPPSLLLDGAYVCLTARGVLREAPRGRRSEFRSSTALPGDVWRLLASKRLDEFFLLTREGDVQRRRLAPGLPLIARFRLPEPPYGAASNAEALAFVLVSPPERGQNRHWHLLVTDLDGRARLRAELPAVGASADEDWLSRVVADEQLAISRFEPLVAVGGPTRVSVWDYAEGRLRFTR